MRDKLTPAQYQVTQCAGTEPAFSNALNDEKRDGTFFCICCAQALFLSGTKYDSGSGWPSFFSAVEGAVSEKEDKSLGMRRVEVVCSGCQAHLGHLFPDGPKPSGLRYCMNGTALRFVAREPAPS